MFLDLTTMSAPIVARSARRGHLHRSSALGYASAASERRTAECKVRAPLKRRRLNSEALGLSVGGFLASVDIWAAPVRWVILYK